jgi:hypothetical protein
VREDLVELRSEEDPLGMLQNVERLDARVVASQQQSPLGHVVESQREHAVERRQGIDAVQRQCLQDDLGISRRPEVDAPRLEGRANLAKVVELSVEDERMPPIGSQHGLLAGR